MFSSASVFLTEYMHCSLFFKQEMELSLVGLQNAGKTSLVNAIAVGNTFFSLVLLIYLLS